MKNLGGIGDIGSQVGLILDKKLARKFNKKLFYDINPGNWYQTYPFYFEIREDYTTSNELVCRFFLPIPPQNMTIQDMSTSEAHATIGGVVEETTAGVFSMITLVGTTGLSSSQTDLTAFSQQLNPQFRKYIDDLAGKTNPIAKLVGNVVSGTVNTIVSSVTSFATGETASLPYQSLGSAVVSSNINSSQTGRTVDVLFPNTAPQGPKSGFLNSLASAALGPLGLGDSSPEQYKTVFANGFSWSHGLRQLFLIYQRNKSENNNLGLYFVDAKSGTQYRCVVRSAQFNQNSRNPYLITYNISLKCWDISKTGLEASKMAIDRFAEGNDLATVNVLNVTSAITNFSNTVNKWQRPGSIGGSIVKSSTGSFI